VVVFLTKKHKFNQAIVEDQVSIGMMNFTMAMALMMLQDIKVTIWRLYEIRNFSSKADRGIQEEE